MKILNIHQRTIEAPIDKVVELFTTLATKDDMIWPRENWPRMKLDKGLTIGSNGGHGPIGYKVSEYEPGKRIRFQFSEPKGFIGFHEFQMRSMGPKSTEVKHTIDIQTTLGGTVQWFSFVKWLHDALIEDAYDKVENNLLDKNLQPQWNLWVRILRSVLKA